MKALLVDRLGFERVLDESFAAGDFIVVPRKFVLGQSEFRHFGRVTRDGEEFAEFREVDDMTAELKKAHGTIDWMRGEVRSLERTIRDNDGELARMSLDLRRQKETESPRRFRWPW